VNCWVFPCGVFAETGVITIGETTVTLTVALPLPSVAFAVTVQVVLGYKEAMKSPVEEIDPHVVVHVDATLAVNCIVANSCTVTDVGETVTAKAGKQQQISNGKENVRDKERFKIDPRVTNVGLRTAITAASRDFSNPLAEEKQETPFESGGETIKD
jgi:hypothetical protein